MTTARYSPEKSEASPNSLRKPPANSRKDFSLHFTTEQLQTATEGGILRLIGSLYSAFHPEEKPSNAIALIVGCDPITIQRAMSDEGHLGSVAWVKISQMDNGLWRAWLAAQEDKI